MLALTGPADPPSGGSSLDRAIRKARLAEAAHFDALVDIRDAATLRLQVLKDDLQPVLRGRRETADFIELSLMQGFEPRLWVDLVSYVIMAPDSRTYRFQRDTSAAREVLFETADRKEMAEKITEYAAHRLIERQRLMVDAGKDVVPAAPGYGAVTLLLAWLSGFALGVLALFLAFAILSKAP